MSEHNAITEWAFRQNDRYHTGFSIACEADDGAIYWDDLERGASFAIAVKAKATGSTDIVLCGGIQSLTDARAILRSLYTA